MRPILVEFIASVSPGEGELKGVAAEGAETDASTSPLLAKTTPALKGIHRLRSGRRPLAGGQLVYATGFGRIPTSMSPSEGELKGGGGGGCLPAS